MKQKILLASLGSSGMATLLGIIAVYGGNGKVDGSSIELATVFGLFGIAAFFVGLAYPKTVVETSTVDDRGYMSTREIVNK